MSNRSWAGDSDSAVSFLNRASIVQRPEDGSLLCTELANLTKQDGHKTVSTSFKRPNLVHRWALCSNG